MTLLTPFLMGAEALHGPPRLREVSTAVDVEAPPPEPMHEWSPYRTVHAPHLLEGIVSERGEFRLIALPGGRTRLEGSTWYRLGLYPQAYWSLFSDALIHQIHRRVLDFVRDLSEEAAVARRGKAGHRQRGERDQGEEKERLSQGKG